MRHEPDLVELQQLLDRSYDLAGPHLRDVITPERRLSAEAVAATLTGMRLLVLATVTSDGRPVAGPVDGIFYRGSFHFGSSSESVRFNHIRQRRWVSATHLPGEELSVTVHGQAVPVDVAGTEQAGSVRPFSTSTFPATGRAGRPSSPRIGPPADGWRRLTRPGSVIGPGCRAERGSWLASRPAAGRRGRVGGGHLRR